MKILTIQAAYFPMIGGAEVFHQKTAEWLVKQGHQVDVVTCIWEKPDVAWKDWQKNEEVINGVTVFRVQPWFHTQYLKSFGAIWPLYKRALQLIKQEGYGLIHAHIFPALVVGALLKRKTGLPLVTTIQGGDLADYFETGSTVSWLLKPPISWSLQKADLVHTVSTHMESAVKKLGVKRTIVIPNGVDTVLFKPRNKGKLRVKYHIPHDKFVIISHSRLTPKNGLDILIKAVARLPEKEEVLVLLVGGGEQEAELRQLMLRTVLSKQVRFLGYQDRHTTAELLAASDLFVRPSRQEGFGIAFLEAMAAGLPVVGTRVGGIPEIMTGGKEGLLVKPDDAGELTGILQQLKSDYRLRERIGRAGRKKVKKQFSWLKVYSQMEEMYKEALSSMV